MTVVKALLSIFKRRSNDQRDKEGGLESCDCELQANEDQAECRLVFRLNCRQGVVKTYRLSYESGEILHAAFDQLGSTNHWTASSRTLRDVVEYFGPKTDQLDWYFEGGKVTFTSYTEKVQSGRGMCREHLFLGGNATDTRGVEILKQPMHTSVALERKDFNAFNVQEGLHIGTMVKDFRSIVAHAETMRTPVTARYSRGNRPMQISYGENGLAAEFTLMTRGSANVPSTASNASTRATPARDLSMRRSSRPPEPPTSASSTGPASESGQMPPPARTSFRDRDTSAAQPPSLLKTNSVDSSAAGAPAPAPSASIDPNSLFIPADDDDRQWDEPNFDEEPDIVTWDNNAANDSLSASTSTRRIRDSEMDSFALLQEQEQQQQSNQSRLARSKFPIEIAPTQRLSQFKGIFD